MTKPMILTEDAAERKQIPIITGVLDYFPRALAAVARCSKKGNDQHNPGKPLHWDKTKSTDHADCIGRHLIDRYSLDTDGELHATHLAWRALAMLEIHLEEQEKKEKELADYVNALQKVPDAPEEKPKYDFKVGDIVKIRNYDKNYIIKKVYYLGSVPYFECYSSEPPCGDYTYKVIVAGASLTKIPKKKPKREFKVGGIVRIIGYEGEYVIKDIHVFDGVTYFDCQSTNPLHKGYAYEMAVTANALY